MPLIQSLSPPYNCPVKPWRRNNRGALGLNQNSFHVLNKFLLCEIMCPKTEAAKPLWMVESSVQCGSITHVCFDMPAPRSSESADKSARSQLSHRYVRLHTQGIATKYSYISHFFHLVEALSKVTYIRRKRGQPVSAAFTHTSRARGASREVSLPTLGFELAKFRSQAQHPHPLSLTPPHSDTTSSQEHAI